jgi:Putative MetA-pathway of phenol degradation
MGQGHQMPHPTRRTIRTFFAVVAIHAVSLGHLSAAESDDHKACPDKDQYNLFNPTPFNCMRELHTDRPDVTESPFTVDAGHVQTESDIFNYSRSNPDEDKTVTEKFLFGSTNVRAGLTNNAELDLLLQPYNAVRTRMINPLLTSWNAGPDVLEARTKLNLYGNDNFENQGATALALLPFIDIPTADNGVGENHVEGGVLVPFAVKLSEKAELDLMTGFDLRKNESGAGYHVEYVNTASMSYDLTEKLSTYAEVATVFDNESPFGGIVSLDTGLLYKPKENVQIDVGLNVGVTRAADVINPFVGITKRF